MTFISRKRIASFTPNDGIFPAGAPAFGARNGHPVLKFDPTTDESILFEGDVPEGFGSPKVIVHLFWAAEGATSGDVVWDAQFERMDVDGLDLDTDSFAAVQSVTDTTAAAAGQLSKVTIAFTNAEADGIAETEPFRIKITRDANNASDTMTGDAQLRYVIIEEQQT